MITFQKIIQTARNFIPRGWSPFLRYISRIYPEAKMYPAVLKSGDTLFLDLSENMCHGYFYYGDLHHERYTEAFFKSYIKPGDVFLDVGANIGYFTRLASTLVGKEGCVHAFEPMPSAIRLLKENTKQLRNVHLHEIAISNVQGTSNFSIQAKGDTSSLGASPSSSNVINVCTDTLDNILKNIHKIDVIKIDVEGYEYEVLQGAIEIIHSKRPLLYFEYIDRYASDRGLKIEDFRALLEPTGYSVGWISSDYPDSDLISTTASSYLIAVPTTNRWNIAI